jgi:hypothetical protein
MPTPRLVLPLLIPLALLASGARAQMLIDATGAAAIQGTLQGASTPGYTNLLRNVEGRLKDLGSPAGEPSGDLSGSRERAPKRASTADPSQESLFVVNGRVIRLCPSGLPCIGQVRRAMGLP